MSFVSICFCFFLSVFDNDFGKLVAFGFGNHLGIVIVFFVVLCCAGLFHFIEFSNWNLFFQIIISNFQI